MGCSTSLRIKRSGRVRGTAYCIVHSTAAQAGSITLNLGL